MKGNEHPSLFLTGFRHTDRKAFRAKPLRELSSSALEHHTRPSLHDKASLMLILMLHKPEKGPKCGTKALVAVPKPSPKEGCLMPSLL